MPLSAKQRDVLGLHTGDGREALEVRTGAGDIAWTAIPDSGLLHDWDAQTYDLNNDESVGTFDDNEGSKDLTASGDPVYRESEINGLSAIRYNGTDQKHEDSSAAAVGPNGEYTLAIVFRFHGSSAGDDETVIINGDDDGDFVRWDTRESGDSRTEWRLVHTGTALDFGSTDTDEHVVIASYDGSNLNLWFDGSDEFTNESVSDITPSGQFIIGERGAGDRWARAMVGQVRWHDEYFDSDGRDQYGSTLQERWGF